jgi:SnoaL-like protein
MSSWSVTAFERFWKKPDVTLVGPALAEDVVGWWPGVDEPVRGRDDYTACIAAIVEALPGMWLEVAEHAGSGDFTFVRWVMHATGKNGPFELTGIDRVRVRDGRVCENVIVFDTAAFEARAGIPVPWVERSRAMSR